MAQVNVNPASDTSPILEEGGHYGPGAAHEATVDITEFVSPNNEGLLVNERGMDVMPGYDKEGKDGPYFYWNFKVTLDSGKTVYTRAHTKAKRTKQWLKNLGVAVTDLPDGNYTFDDEFAPLEVKGGIEVKSPRDSKDGERRFTGDVVGVFAG